MEFGFDHQQLNEDIQDFKNYFKGFGKSFGPKTKKVGLRELGFLEEQHIRFRLSLVDMGMPKIIRTCIVFIVGIILFFTVFVRADAIIQLIVAFGFFSYVVWMFLPHIEDSAKAGSTVASALKGFHATRVSTQESVGGWISGVFQSLNPFSKGSEEAPKGK